MNRTDDNRLAGFTLIEILLVIALMVLLSAFTLPEFVQFDKREQLKSVANDVVDVLKFTQSYAASGVQSGGDFTSWYRFSFFHDDADPAGSYRGYQVSRVGADGQQMGVPLEEKVFECPVCISAAVGQVNFKVPTGRVDSGIGSSLSTVCVPNIGSYDVSIDGAGGVTRGVFVPSACGCYLNTCP